MGYTRIIYTDATTAEASAVLKGLGFLEGDQGGLFTNGHSSVKIYLVWGRSGYYPEIFRRLDFVPRVQIHLKCREDRKDLADFALSAAAELRGLSPDTKVRVFNADSGEESG